VIVMLLPLVLLLLQQAAPDPRPAPTRPGLSWAQADSLTQKLDAFEKARPKSPGNVKVSEGEINSYVNLSMAGKLPAGLQNPEFHFDKDRVVATADVDFEQLRKTMPNMSSLNPLAYLGGRVALLLRGRVQSPEDGFGSFEFEQARLGPVTLPTSMLAQMVASCTHSPQYPQGFDVLSPFRLPYSLKKIRLQPGQAVLEY
jgi:hypothetical protein